MVNIAKELQFFAVYDIKRISVCYPVLESLKILCFKNVDVCRPAVT